MAEKTYMAVEDLEVYRKLCQLHLEVCDLTHQWPAEERCLREQVSGFGFRVSS